MDHPRIEEECIVERYLLGCLTPEEVTRFEAHYLDCPECVESLELGKTLRDGLREVAASEGTERVHGGAVAWLARRGPVLRGVLAAALLALVVLPWALLAPGLDRLGGELAGVEAPRLHPPVYALSAERSGSGAAPSTRITLGPKPERVVLELQLPPEQSAGTYRLRLREVGGQTLWQRDGVEPDAKGRVTVSVHSSWLEASAYIIELDTLTAEGHARSAGRFAFAVRRGE